MRLGWAGAVLMSACALLAAPARAETVKPGGKVPDLGLTGLDGKSVPLDALLKGDDGKARPAVLVVWCSTCPSCRMAEDRIAAFAGKYKDRAAVCFLDANLGETPEKAKAALAKKKLEMPVLFDAAGASVNAFGLSCTTTALVIDGSGVLRYHGRFDQNDNRYAEDALTAVLDGKDVAVATTAEAGCGIVRDASKPHAHGAHAPAEAKPADAKPAEAKPSEAKPSEAKKE
ncbi:MAG: redoxin domain-containing protein [Planctomycetota bacterium]|nr:redoxin domain-containing protein [Planctomycetota bacterium]